jgi:hypothetical protein
VKPNGSKSNGRSCVSTHGFDDKPNSLSLFSKGPEMETNILSQILSGTDPYIQFWVEPIESLYRLTKKRVLSQNIEHLFGPSFPT